MDAAEYRVTVGRAVPRFDPGLGAFLYGLSMFLQHHCEQKCCLNCGLSGTGARLNQKSEHIYKLLVDKR